MGKHDGLFVTEAKECAADMVNEGAAAEKPLPFNLSEPWALLRAADVPQASCYITTSWVGAIDHEEEWVEEHVHDYDEVLMFLGNDPDDVNDLGGEIFMTIEGERHLLTTTSAVFIPAGTRHCPLGFTRVDRPLRFVAVALSADGNYQ